MMNTATKLSQMPVRAMSLVRSRSLLKTMVLGGVATGSIKAHEALSTTGTNTCTGLMGNTCTNEYNMGSTNSVDAVLDVSSVRKVMKRQSVITNTNGCTSLSPCNLTASHSDKPDISNPCANAKPPPNKKIIPNGRRCISSHRIIPPRSLFAGYRYNTDAISIAAVLSFT